MSTNCTIAIQHNDGSVTGILVHWDGGLWHAGPILYHHYSTEEKVRELLALGHLSSIDVDIDSSVAYGRDRGESNQQAIHSASWIEFLSKYEREYNYIFDDNEWIVKFSGSYYSELESELKRVSD